MHKTSVQGGRSNNREKKLATAKRGPKLRFWTDVINLCSLKKIKNTIVVRSNSESSASTSDISVESEEKQENPSTSSDKDKQDALLISSEDPFFISSEELVDSINPNPTKKAPLKEFPPLKTVLCKILKQDQVSRSKMKVKFMIPEGGPFGGGKYARLRKKGKKPPRSLTPDQVELRIKWGIDKRKRKEEEKLARQKSLQENPDLPLPKEKRRTTNAVSSPYRGAWSPADGYRQSPSRFRNQKRRKRKVFLGSRFNRPNMSQRKIKKQRAEEAMLKSSCKPFQKTLMLPKRSKRTSRGNMLYQKALNSLEKEPQRLTPKKSKKQ